MNENPFHKFQTIVLILPLMLIILIISSCENPSKKAIKVAPKAHKEIIIQPEKVVLVKCALKDRLDSAGLVNVQRLKSKIKVDLKYTTTDNFMGMDLYGCLDSLYLQARVTTKLLKCQKKLTELDSSLVLLVYDGVRPLSVQQMMWDSLDMPLSEKIKFVSNPRNGSLHNYGAAVDLTIFDLKGDTILDMGAPYDHIGIEAWPTQELVLLNKGVLTQAQVDHRKLLRKVMKFGGFFNIQTEWWHFNSCRREKAKIYYKIVE